MEGEDMLSNSSQQSWQLNNNDCNEILEDGDIEPLVQTLEGKRRKMVVKLLCHVVHTMYLVGVYYNSKYVDRSFSRKSAEVAKIRQELMAHLSFSDNCRAIIRMGPNAFAKLCDILRDSGRLKDNKWATVEEQVAKFLFIIGHGERNRSIAFFFRRSGETISRHFHMVLRAIITLEAEFLKQPNGVEIPSEILNSPRFYPYFKDCVGAIDGTHIRVKVPTRDAPRFRGRKDYPTQNVLAACSFDMKFTYVLPGWEGTASDSRIIKNALTREDKLTIPTGKYYLVDAGFMLTAGLMAPYRGVRYHLKEYSARGPENAHELFNHRHAALRNVIERAFGVLKKRFSIISGATEPNYPFETQTEIVLACCILHNYLMGVDPDLNLIDEVDRELLLSQSTAISGNNCNEDFGRGAILRQEIADKMWHDYRPHTLL